MVPLQFYTMNVHRGYCLIHSDGTSVLLYFTMNFFKIEYCASNVLEKSILISCMTSTYNYVCTCKSTSYKEFKLFIGEKQTVTTEENWISIDQLMWTLSNTFTINCKLDAKCIECIPQRVAHAVGLIWQFILMNKNNQKSTRKTNTEIKSN